MGDDIPVYRSPGERFISDVARGQDSFGSILDASIQPLPVDPVLRPLIVGAFHQRTHENYPTGDYRRLPEAFSCLYLSGPPGARRLHFSGPHGSLNQPCLPDLHRTATLAYCFSFGSFGLLFPEAAPEAAEANPLAEDLLGVAGRRFEERINCTARTPMQEHALVEAELRQRLSRSRHRHDDPVLRLGPLLAAASSTLSLSQLCREIGISERHLRRLTLTNCGMSPVRLRRVMRIGNTVLNMIGLQEQPPGSQQEICRRLGYSGTSHLHHEFQDLLGQAPGQVARSLAEDPLARALWLRVDGPVPQTASTARGP